MTENAAPDAPRHGNSRDLAAAASLVLIGLLFHLSALGGWWKNDDPQVLLQALHDTPAELLFSPHAYRTLSTSSFTPLVTISFDLDLQLAGVNPRPFYIHQIIVTLLASLALYLLGKTLYSRFAGWSAGLLFLVAPTTVDAVRALMLRHYLEGGLVAALALAIALNRKIPPRIAAALPPFLYLIAILEKEFYAPLPLFILMDSIIRHDTWVKTIRRLVPYGIVAIVYLVWRRIMLGSGGGYGAVDLHAFLLLPARLARAIAGGAEGRAFIAILSLCLLALFAAALKWNRSAAITAAAAAAVFVAMPLFFVASDFDARYGFAAMMVLAILCGVVASRALATSVLMMLLIVLLGAAGWSEGQRNALQSRQMLAEGHYVWEKPPGSPPLVGGSPGWYLGGLAEIREELAHARAPRFVLSFQPFFTGENDPRAAVESHPDGSIAPLSRGELASIEAERAKYRPAEPLSLTFSRPGSDLHWEVGPAPASFTFISWPEGASFRLPAKGWRRIPEATEKEWFRVRRDAPDGTWTISPVEPVPESGQTVRWSR